MFGGWEQETFFEVRGASVSSWKGMGSLVGASGGGWQIVSADDRKRRRKEYVCRHLR